MRDRQRLMLPCVILAGGLGTRMRPFTERMPKALIPIGGRPFADWQLEWLASQSIHEVIYSIGHKGDMLRAHVRDGARFGVTVRYVDEGKNLRGTGGALRLALDQGALPSTFFLLYGDSYLPTDFTAVQHAWEASGLRALMTVFKNQGKWDSSNAVYADGRLLLYDKSRPPEIRSRMRWIDYGLSVMTSSVVADLVVPGAVADVADIFRTLSREGHLAGYEVFDRFYEAGSAGGVRDLEAYLAQRVRR